MSARDWAHWLGDWVTYTSLAWLYIMCTIWAIQDFWRHR